MSSAGKASSPAAPAKNPAARIAGGIRYDGSSTGVTVDLNSAPGLKPITGIAVLVALRAEIASSGGHQTRRRWRILPVLGSS
jgi:hypothetical protein